MTYDSVFRQITRSERGNEMYRITMITDLKRKERTDGRYPLRKGCIVDIIHLVKGSCMLLLYIKDNEGNDKAGILRTSTVQDFTWYEEKIAVRTLNSIYYLVKE